MAERLTDRFVNSCKPTGTDVMIFDSVVPGLALRIYASGKKSWVFDYREPQTGKQRRPTIGSPPAWTVGKARSFASKLRLRVDAGEIVSQPKARVRLADLTTEWVQMIAKTRRPRTVMAYKRLLRCHIVPTFGALDPAAVTHEMIATWHANLGTRIPSDANRALGALSSFFSWLRRRKGVTHNPCGDIERKVEHAREVFLSSEEIATAHRLLAVDPAPAALALRLLLLTGARVGEVCGLTRAQLDVAHKRWIKHGSTTKQNKTHVLPLQPEALAIALDLIKAGVPQYHVVLRFWNRIRVNIGRPDCRVHDLRHSRASSLARAGASLLQIGAVLGHGSPRTTQRYAHLISDDLVELIEKAK